jgi:hypothetical protein
MKSRTRIGYLSAIALGAFTLQALPALAQKNPLVGEWQLVSAKNTDDKGVTKVGSFGPNPLGRIVFTESGHYISVNTHPDLPKFENRMKGTPDQYKAVVQGSTASYGTYKLAPDGKSVTVHQDAGTFAIRNGWEEKRDLQIKGDEMRYTTTATYGGKSELVYKRVK